MIVTKMLRDGRIYTYSDENMKIRQETGIVYDSAVDTVPHSYTETDEPIDMGEVSSEEILADLEAIL